MRIPFRGAQLALRGQFEHRGTESARFEDTLRGRFRIFGLIQLRIVTPYNFHSGLAVILPLRLANQVQDWA